MLFLKKRASLLLRDLQTRLFTDVELLDDSAVAFDIYFD